MGVDVDQCQPGLFEGAGEQVAVEGVGLEHGDGVEHVGESGGALQFGESEVAVAEGGGLFGLHAGEQFADPFGGGDAHPHGQGVDEQADHVFHTGQMWGPVGDGIAEHDIGASGHDAEQYRPGDLHGGVGGDAVGAGETGDRGADLGSEAAGDHPAGAGRGPIRAAGHQGGCFHSGEHLLPGGDRGGAVLGVQPMQIFAVGAGGGQVGGAAVGDVEGEQFMDEQRHRPAVEHDVVVGHQQFEFVCAGADQMESQQGRPGGVERARRRSGDAFARACGIVAESGEVGVMPLGAYRAHHDLAGARGAVDEGGAQGVVAVEQCLGGATHAVAVQAPAQGQFGLNGVAVFAGGVVDGVEQQPGLQCGQRPHIGGRGVVDQPSVDLVLGDGDQREVRGGEPARGIGFDVGGQCAQRPCPQPGQFLDVGCGQDSGGEFPGRVEFEPVGPGFGNGVDV